MPIGEAISGNEAPDALAEALDLGFVNDAIIPSDHVNNYNLSALTREVDVDNVHEKEQPAPESLPYLPTTSTPDFELQSLPAGTLDIANRSTEPSIGSSGVLSRLARLNDGIAYQLLHMETFVLGSTSPNLIHSCVDKASDLRVNPILWALESTSELTAIVKEIISPIRDQRSTSLITPVMLMCLSGHIQLLQIYNSIFLHVQRFLSGLHDISRFFEDLPSFTHIGGLPPIKGDLYIKIVVQVAQHNIGNLEKAIGLPTDLCLSAQRTLPKSLFGCLDSPDVFQLIMDQTCNSSEESGRALVASLRTNIGSVLDILRNDS